MTGSPITVELLRPRAGDDHTAVARLASFAAQTCYDPERPDDEKIIDLENRIVKVGHHTVLQHSSFTFFVEGIAVSAITLGLHLSNPFYNASQRSGRYCAEMFANPDLDAIERYVRHFWPERPEATYRAVLAYVSRALDLYRAHLPAATEAARQAIRRERPNAGDAFVERNAPKFAQEQLRVLVPTVFPTAVTYTVDLSALAALHRAAWNPDLRDVAAQMAELARPHLRDGRGGNLADALFGSHGSKRDWTVPATPLDERFEDLSCPVREMHEPRMELEAVVSPERYADPDRDDTFPLDLLHFRPEYMDGNSGRIHSRVWVSLATMGQDQRHRTVGRGTPEFTSYAYVPPLVREIGAGPDVVSVVTEWRRLRRLRDDSLVERVSPYGAVLRYRKSASFNAATHEYEKRTCWNTQEEIHRLSVLTAQSIPGCADGKSPLSPMFMPGCMRTGRCVEGPRYCGRRMTGDVFAKRTV